MSERICYGCKWFELDEGSPYYSELTPGDSFSISCLKNKWTEDWKTEEGFRKCLETANTCPEFSPRDFSKNKYEDRFPDQED